MPSLSAVRCVEFMAGVVHRATSLGTPRSTGEAAVPLRATVLTAVALVTLALGLVLLMLPSLPVAPELPSALFAVALAVLAVTLAWSRDARPVSSPAGSFGDLDSPPEILPGAPRSIPEPTPADPQRVRSNFPGRGSAWRVLSTPSGPGDETWLSWLPRETRRLGGDGASVVPGVVTSSGKAGNLVAFPVRDYFGGALPPGARGAPSSVPLRTRGRGLVGDEHLPPLSSPRASPFSEEELDRMFPPEGPHTSVFLPAPPDRVGTRSPWSPTRRFGAAPVPTTTELTGAFGTPADEPVSGNGSTPLGECAAGYDTSDAVLAPNVNTIPPSTPVEGRATPPTELRLEAANPTPPHLRPVGAFLRCEPQTIARPGKRTFAPRSVCASCSRVVIDLHLSGPCPKCLRPLCDVCLREALATQGHGWCLDCSTSTVAG